MSCNTTANEHFRCGWSESLKTDCVTKPLFLLRLNNTFVYSDGENAKQPNCLLVFLPLVCACRFVSVLHLLMHTNH